MGALEARNMGPSVLDFFPPIPESPSQALVATPGIEEAASQRALLIGPAGCGKSSLLLQYALNRASRGLTTLYVHCGPPDSLAHQPPVRPRLAARSNAGTSAETNEEAQLFRMILIKYVESWADLRLVLATMHMAEAMPADAPMHTLPSGLLIDGLSSLAGLGATAAGPSQSTPSPIKFSSQHAAMSMALAFALAAHAADLLDEAILHPPQPSPLPPPGAARERAVLLITCTTPGPEADLACRWVNTMMRIIPVRSSGAGSCPHYMIRATCGTLDTDIEEVAYAFDQRSLRLVDDAHEPSPLSQERMGPSPSRETHAAHERRTRQRLTESLPARPPTSGSGSRGSPAAGAGASQLDPLASAVY